MLTLAVPAARVGKNPGFLQKTQPTRVFWKNPWVFLKSPGLMGFLKFKWVFKRNITKRIAIYLNELKSQKHAHLL